MVPHITIQTQVFNKNFFYGEECMKNVNVQQSSRRLECVFAAWLRREKKEPVFLSSVAGGLLYWRIISHQATPNLNKVLKSQPLMLQDYTFSKQQLISNSISQIPGKGERESLDVMCKYSGHTYKKGLFLQITKQHYDLINMTCQFNSTRVRHCRGQNKRYNPFRHSHTLIWEIGHMKTKNSTHYKVV